MINHSQFILQCDFYSKNAANSQFANHESSKNSPEVPKIGNNWDILLRKMGATQKKQAQINDSQDILIIIISKI